MRPQAGSSFTGQSRAVDSLDGLGRVSSGSWSLGPPDYPPDSRPAGNKKSTGIRSNLNLSRRNDCRDLLRAGTQKQRMVRSIGSQAENWMNVLVSVPSPLRYFDLPFRPFLYSFNFQVESLYSL